jgi:regulator of protease activity HflC (stomatin/prohibitin superfamily)
MDTFNRFFGRLAWGAITVLGFLFLLNIGLSLLSAPANLDVMAGVVLILFAIYLGGVSLTSLFKTFGRKAAILLLMLPLLSACTIISPGYAGVKVNQWGDDKGVASAPLVTGRVVYNPISTSVFEFPTFMQTTQWEKEEALTFNSKDGTRITAAFSLGYQLKAEKVPEFYVKFRTDDLERFTDGYLHNVARDAVNEAAVQYTTEQIYGEKKEELLAKVRERINAHVGPFGIEVQQFGIVGALDLPPPIVAAMNAKIEAIQNAIMIENQLRSSEAEAKKTVAVAEGAAKARIATAEGEAAANRALTASLSSTLWEWKRLEIQAQATQKWDGGLPHMITGSGTVPFIQLPTTTK